MEKKLQDKFKRILLDEKERLEKELNMITHENLQKSQTEMSGENAYEDDEADVATTTFERERDDSLIWNIRDLLNKINDSLYNISKGTYGICSNCGEQISLERLKALPYAENCLRCQSKKSR